ncbi:DUF255 domain-containing protein [Flavivirga amylovorans]|uniref:DUF255 domain-containing protein n=1 Tax=Flavivirga amylovorans TaxID=870486 RepID=A0ABT8X7M0_9FLAO|nr:thioredoxin fold domain-containing protein [Flavivirga amylovorans]MDO5989529.1 DUF255 domain-containing protein [Flavivirga amylovorans]
MDTSKKGLVFFYVIVIIPLSLFLSCGNIQAQGINFETGDWVSVLKKAKNTNKLIFIDVYTTWCKPCKQMAKNIFTNKEVGDYFNTHFISYKLDAEKGKGINLSKKYAVDSYPNLLFVDGNGKLVIRRKGSMGVKEILEFGNKAMLSKSEVTNMRSTYNAGDRSPKFIIKYLAFLKERDLPTEEIMISYLARFEKKQWLSKDNLKLIQAYIQSPYNEVIEYLGKCRAEFANSTLGSYWIPVILDSVYKQYLKQIIEERKEQKDVDTLLSHASLMLSPKEVAYYDFISKRLITKRDQDWDSYIKYTIAYVNTHALDQPTALNNFAWGFYKNNAITDYKVLNEALGWVNRALQNKENYSFLDTKAALLYKLHRKEDALMAANNAVKLAEENARDASETLRLIEKIKEL